MRDTSKTSNHSSRTPRPVASDSDVVVLALVTAEALESQGEVREAARWLRRGADQARREGNEERVLMLARAAAHLTNVTRPAPLLSSSRSMAKRQSSIETTTEAMLALLGAAG
jgi:hypothetical protein